MKKHIIIIGLSLFVAQLSFAQGNDSLKSQLLSEVIIEGIKTEADTLQNFYRSNASATTETILSRLRSVTLIRRGSYGQEPVLRGLSNGQLNLTIDGMKIFGACTDKMDPITIYVEPWNLSAIQSVPGPMGSQFGSTIGGSLNLMLAQPVVGKPGVNGKGGIDFQSSARSVNYFSALNIGKNASAYRLNMTYRKSHNYHDGHGIEVLFSQYEKLNIAASGKWSIGKSDTLQGDVLFDQGWNIGFPALPMDVGKASAGIFSISYHRHAPWYFFHNISTKIYHNSIAHNMDDTHRKNVTMHMDMPGRSQTTGMYMEGDLHVSHQHKTRLKVDYFANKLLGEMTMIPDEGLPMYMQTAPEVLRQNGGLFIQQQLKLNSRNKLFISFRTDIVKDQLADGIGLKQWEIFDPSIKTAPTHFLKTFSVNYTRNLTNNMMLEVNGGYGERMATLNERYGFYLFNRFDGYDYLGNPKLKNEHSWNADVNVTYFSDKIELQLTPFFQRIDHYILGQVAPDLSVMTFGANGVKQNNNLDHAFLHGFDVMMLVRPVASLQWVTTVKYTRGRTATAEALPLIAPLKSVTSLRYEMKRWDVQGEWEWSASQNHVSHSFGEKRTNAFAIISLRTGWKINTSWSVNAGIENLLDTYYREHLDWGGIPRPGRNIYLNVMFKLSNK